MEEGMSDHSADAGKMACRHEPVHSTLVHVCKHCGESIKQTDCIACGGIGLSGTSDRRCPVCKGTGIDRWEAVT